MNQIETVQQWSSRFKACFNKIMSVARICGMWIKNTAYTASTVYCFGHLSLTLLWPEIHLLKSCCLSKSPAEHDYSTHAHRNGQLLGEAQRRAVNLITQQDQTGEGKETSQENCPHHLSWVTTAQLLKVHPSFLPSFFLFPSHQGPMIWRGLWRESSFQQLIYSTGVNRYFKGKWGRQGRTFFFLNIAWYVA